MLAGRHLALPSRGRHRARVSSTHRAASCRTPVVVGLLTLVAGAGAFRAVGTSLVAEAEPSGAVAASGGHTGESAARSALAARDAERQDHVSRAGVRPAAPETAEDEAPGPTGGCAADDLSGSHTNGALDGSELCDLPQSGHQLHGDAAAAWWQLNAAFKNRFGANVCVTDSYRTFAAQQQAYGAKPGLAAVPGTSNHGLAIAVDLCGGVESGQGAAYEWLRLRAEDFGWDNPEWARPDGSRPEPWHWEYVDA